jgi:hypothetical protein
MKIEILNRTIPHPIAGTDPGSAVLEDGGSTTFGASADGKLVLPAGLDPGHVVRFERGSRSLRARVVSVGGDVLELEPLAPPAPEPDDPVKRSDLLEQRAQAAERAVTVTEAAVSPKADAVTKAQVAEVVARKAYEDHAMVRDSALRAIMTTNADHERASDAARRAIEVRAQADVARADRAAKASDLAILAANTRDAAERAPAGAVKVALGARADQVEAAAADAAKDLDAAQRTFDEADAIARDADAAAKAAYAVVVSSLAARSEALEVNRRLSREHETARLAAITAVRTVEAAGNAVEVQRKVAAQARQDADMASAAVAQAKAQGTK